MRRLVGLAVVVIAALAPGLARADDQEIASQLVEKLREQQELGTLEQFSVDLEVDKGTVWMKGSVATADQQRLALAVAQRISGVKKVINELVIDGSTETEPAPQPLLLEMNQPAKKIERKSVVVQPTIEDEATPVAARGSYGSSDDQIGQEVIERLRQQKLRGHLRNFKVNVDVTDGSVWVRGRVASVAQQQLVLDIARRVPGVTQVVNDLTVNSAVERTSAESPLPIRNEPAIGSGARSAGQMPLAFSSARVAAMPSDGLASSGHGAPLRSHFPSSGLGAAPARYDHPHMPGYAWPSYAPYPNYGAVSYPKQYSPSAWPYIGPFYPYPQVPLGWRKVTLQWDDGWWFLDFKAK